MTPFDSQIRAFDRYEVAKDVAENMLNVPTTQSTCTQTCGCDAQVEMDDYVPPYQTTNAIQTNIPTTQSTCTQTCGCDAAISSQNDYIAPMQR